MTQEGQVQTVVQHQQRLISERSYVVVSPLRCLNVEGESVAFDASGRSLFQKPCRYVAVLSLGWLAANPAIRPSNQRSSNQQYRASREHTAHVPIKFPYATSHRVHIRAPLAKSPRPGGCRLELLTSPPKFRSRISHLYLATGASVLTYLLVEERRHRLHGFVLTSLISLASLVSLRYTSTRYRITKCEKPCLARCHVADVKRADCSSGQGTREYFPGAPRN